MQLGVSVSGSKGWNVISLGTALIQIRSFMMMFFGLITLLRDRKPSSSVIFTSLTFIIFSGEVTFQCLSLNVNMCVYCIGGPNRGGISSRTQGKTKKKKKHNRHTQQVVMTCSCFTRENITNAHPCEFQRVVDSGILRVPGFVGGHVFTNTRWLLPFWFSKFCSIVMELVLSWTSVFQTSGLCANVH